MVETTDTDKKHLHEQMFLRLVSWLYTSCMQHLGKLADAETGRVERDLPSAQASIEMLRMLRAKTEGNLSKSELETVEQALSNMQLNYVEELRRSQAAAAPKAEPGGGNGAKGSKPAEAD